MEGEIDKLDGFIYADGDAAKWVQRTSKSMKLRKSLKEVPSDDWLFWIRQRLKVGVIPAVKAQNRELSNYTIDC